MKTYRPSLLNFGKRAATHIISHLFAYTLCFLILASLFITFTFPVYFRTDDATYLNWAKTYAISPWSALDPTKAVMSGHFRPVHTLTWWVLYTLFGSNPFPYQLFTTLLYGLSFICFFILVEHLFSRRIAFFSAGAYLVIFLSLSYIVFWFSDINYLLGLFFINLSIYLLVKGIKHGNWLPWGISGYILGSFSRELDVIIVPSVIVVFVASQWHRLSASERKRGIFAVAVLAILALSDFLLNPFLRSGQGLPFSAVLSSEGLQYILHRWNFYSGQISSGTGFLIWVSALNLCLYKFTSTLIRQRRFMLFTAIQAVLCIAAVAGLRASPAIALIALVVFLASLVLLNSTPEVIVAGWIIPPLFAIMAPLYLVRTYLTEASFGMVIVVGIATNTLIQQCSTILSQLSVRRKTIGGIAIAVICVAVFASGAFKLSTSMRALQSVSDNRQTFRNVVEYIQSNLTKPDQQVIIIDYSDMGLNYQEDVMPVSDVDKAQIQKTMESRDFRIFTRVLGYNNIGVNSWTNRDRSSTITRPIVFIMNTQEKAFLESQNLSMRKVFETSVGQQVAWLYALD